MMRTVWSVPKAISKVATLAGVLAGERIGRTPNHKAGTPRIGTLVLKGHDDGLVDSVIHIDRNGDCSWNR